MKVKRHDAFLRPDECSIRCAACLLDMPFHRPRFDARPFFRYRKWGGIRLRLAVQRRESCHPKSLGFRLREDATLKVLASNVTDELIVELDVRVGLVSGAKLHRRPRMQVELTRQIVGYVGPPFDGGAEWFDVLFE